MMNREQVKALFDQEAVSFGNCDGVPIRRYLTATGFHLAAAYRNAVEIGKREEQEDAADA